MNVSLNWLSDFLRRPLDAADAAARLGALGAPADAIEPLHADLGGIIVALVKSAEPHPNADRLRVCLVDDGSGTDFYSGLQDGRGVLAAADAPYGYVLPDGAIVSNNAFLVDRHVSLVGKDDSPSDNSAAI